MVLPSWRVLPVLAALGCVPAPVQAHAILLESQPESGSFIAAGHVDIRLRFNSRIDAGRSRLTLTRPDSSQAVLPAQGEGAGNILTTAADLAPGAYSLRWQVLAIDGHITRGDVAFTVAGN